MCLSLFRSKLHFSLRMDLAMTCSSLSLLFFFSLHIHFPVPSSGEFQKFLDCAPYDCGNQEIGYPFRHVEQPSYCGYPGYELDCDGGNLTLSMKPLEYGVIRINGSAKILEVVRKDLSEDLCAQPFVDTTLNFTLFNYTSSDSNFTLFFNCGSWVNPSLYRFTCPTSRDSYFAPSADPANPLPGVCKASVLVPISREALDLPPSSTLEGGNYGDDIIEVLNEGFEITWIADTSQCKSCNESGGRCGYDSKHEEFNCFCHDGAYLLTCDGERVATGNRRIGLKFGIGFVGAASGIAGMVFIYFICKLCQRKKSDQSSFVSRSISSFYTSKTDFEKGKQMSKYLDGETQIEGLVFSRRYTYKDIKEITNSFKEKLGQGGYGSVYKGKLQDGQLVAVKLLKQLKGDAEEFFNEVASISRTSHVNIVSLVGFCLEGSKRALVYEFMPNGSLEKFIFNKSSTLAVDRQLSWDILYQISLGIAHGLEYLHKGCNTRIVHFDIKPHNILLDANYCPKISDFGLAKICPRQESTVSMLGARGTPGYIAPELIMRNIGGVSHKSDVYSYGMMILEMVDRRKNIEVTGDHTSETYFPYWVNRCLKLQEELRLHGITNEEDEVIMKKMVVIGLWCIQIDPRARPCMTQVVEMLKGSVDALQIPPKPSFSSPSRSPMAFPCESSSLLDSKSWRHSRSIIREHYSL